MDIADTRASVPRLEGGFGFPLGFGVGAVVTAVSTVFGATSHPGWALAAECGAVAAVSTITTVAASAATVAVCWTLYAGFILGHAGALALTAASGWALLILLAVALTATASGALIRAVSARRRVSPGVPAQRATEPDGHRQARMSHSPTRGRG